MSSTSNISIARGAGWVKMDCSPRRWTLADSHVHLDRYPPAEAEAMLGRARAAGVQHFLTIGVDEASSVASVELAARQADVLAAIGIHPIRIGGHDLAVTMARLRALAHRPRVAAIGEIGLDQTSSTPLSEQAAFFGACLDLAAELDLAVSLHIVGAQAQAQQILAERQGIRSVIHYFQGDAALAEAYLALGCHIAVGKPATRPKRVALREAVRQIPLNRLLLETDTYPLPGRTTEPRDIVDICAAVAELKGLAFKDVAQATTDNYLRLFVPPSVGHNHPNR